MTRVAVGTPTWGTALNTDITSVETKADQALAAVAANGTLNTSSLDLTGATTVTAGLQALLNASTEREMFLPYGIYKCATTLIVPAGKTLTMSKGTTLLAVTATAVTLSDDATLRGGTIDGSAADYCSQVGGHRATFDGVTIKNGGYGIGHGSSKNDARVVGCRFLDNGSYGVLVEHAAARTIIDGNTFLSTSSTTQQGVTIKANVNGNPTDTRISNNVCDVAGVIGLEIQGIGATRTVITGNVVRNADIGISLSQSDGATVTGNTCSACPTYGIEAAQGTTNSTIVGNTLLACGVGVIVSSGAVGVPPSVNCVVSDNMIYRSVVYGIAIEYGDGHIISGNRITDPGDRAIFLNNAPTRVMISGNLITRTNAVTPVNSEGIYLTGTRHTVSGNVIDFSARTTTIGYGIFFNGGVGVNNILNNVISKAVKSIALIGSGGAAIFKVVGNVTEESTEHSIYTSAVNVMYLDAHSMIQNGGVGVDTSGVTYPFIGNVYIGDLAKVTSGVTQLDAALRMVNQTTDATAPAAGGAGALPATPAGYITVKINGTDRKLPYY